MLFSPFACLILLSMYTSRLRGLLQNYQNVPYVWHARAWRGGVFHEPKDDLPISRQVLACYNNGIVTLDFK